MITNDINAIEQQRIYAVEQLVEFWATRIDDIAILQASFQRRLYNIEAFK